MLAFVWGGITAMLSARDLWTAVWTTCNVFPVFLLLPGALTVSCRRPGGSRWAMSLVHIYTEEAAVHNASHVPGLFP